MAWLFFVVFILIATFTMLNLFIGVVVNAIQMEHDLESAETEKAAAAHLDAQHAKTRAEVQGLRDEVRQLSLLLQQNMGRSSGAGD